MNTFDPSEFLPLYLSTANEYLAKISGIIESGTVNCTTEELQNMFMSAHSLKGQSLAINFQNTGNASRELEKIFQNHISNNSPFSDGEIQYIKKCIEFIQKSLDSIETTGQEKEPMTE